MDTAINRCTCTLFGVGFYDCCVPCLQQRGGVLLFDLLATTTAKHTPKHYRERGSSTVCSEKLLLFENYIMIHTYDMIDARFAGDV